MGKVSWNERGACTTMLPILWCFLTALRLEHCSQSATTQRAALMVSRAGFAKGLSAHQMAADDMWGEVFNCVDPRYSDVLPDRHKIMLVRWRCRRLPTSTSRLATLHSRRYYHYLW